jgi:hypothetical protein
LKALLQKNGIDRVEVIGDLSSTVILGALFEKMNARCGMSKDAAAQLQDDVFDIIRCYHLLPEYIKQHGPSTMHAIIYAASHPCFFAEDLLAQALAAYEYQNRDEWLQECFGSSGDAERAGALLPPLLLRLLGDHAKVPHAGVEAAVKVCYYAGPVSTQPCASACCDQCIWRTC